MDVETTHVEVYVTTNKYQTPFSRENGIPVFFMRLIGKCRKCTKYPVGHVTNMLKTKKYYSCISYRDNVK